jgi:hypothetical protein
MSKAVELDSDYSSIPSSCRHAMDQLQRVFDGELQATILDTDAHAVTCEVCRKRIKMAQLLIRSLAVPRNTLKIVPKMTEVLVESLLSDFTSQRRLRFRRRAFAVAASVTVAAGVLLTVWLWRDDNSDRHDDPGKAEVAKEDRTPEHNVDPLSQQSEPDPSHQTVRLDEEFSKAEQAFLDTSRPITEPVAVAPQVLAKLTDAFTPPTEAVPEFEAARMSIVALPDVAKTGLEPVTDTTQKAFARLLRDMGVVQLAQKQN